jgi:hypothetical protein
MMLQAGVCIQAGEKAFCVELPATRAAVGKNLAPMRSETQKILASEASVELSRGRFFGILGIKGIQKRG